MPGGRPSKLTPARAKKIHRLIRGGMGREKAARLAGIDPSTFHRWMADGRQYKSGKYHEFREGVLRAEAELQHECTDVFTDLLKPGVNPGIRLGAAKFLLERRFPEDFSQRREVRTTGADGGPIQVQTEVTVAPLVSDEQLQGADPAQLAAIVAGAAAAAGLASAEGDDEGEGGDDGV